MVRAGLAAEKAGARSVSIVGQGFLPQAKMIGRSFGRDVAVVEYPGVIMTDGDDALRAKVAGELVPRIVEALALELEAVAPPPSPSPRDIVYRGTLDELQEYFHENLWTDGLPIVPPTISRVERFMRCTDRLPDEVLGVLQPESREATIWNVAANGVMAGCRPEYMPLLIAVVEAIADPSFRIQDAGSTPGWEPLIIVNGPIVKELDFNSGQGVMRVGRQSNTSLGRFLRLYMRNIAGWRIPPGRTDKGTIGFTFNVALAENEDVVEEIGWQPFSVTKGFRGGENVVTVQSVVSISPPIYAGGDTAIDLAKTIGHAWGLGDCAYWCGLGIKRGRWHPLLVMSPSIARAMARDGWTKQTLAEYLYENVKIPAWMIEWYMRQIGTTDFDLVQYSAKGLLPKEYAESEDPNRLVRVFLRPEWIGIVVAGDPARNQVRGYINNHTQGIPISKRVILPARWAELLGSVKRPQMEELCQGDCPLPSPS